MKKLNILIFFFIFLCTLYSHSQKIVSDTLIIHFNPIIPDSIKIPAKIDSVLDLRNVANPHLLSIDEIKRYGVVPVDRDILSSQPLAQAIHQALPCTDDSENHISVGIRHFEFLKQKHFLFFNRSLLTVSMQFDDKRHISPAVFYYKTSFIRFFKSHPLKTSYQKHFTRFIRNVSSDLNTFASALSAHSDNLSPYDPDSPWHFLHVGSDMVYTFSGYMLDGYLYFNYPETKRTTLQASSVLRYRNENDFESLEYKIVNDFVYFRLNTAAALRLKSQLMLGINRWKDVNLVKHELYDAMIVDLSLAQSIHYFPVNRKSILFGFGIQESIYYIYSHGFQFQLGFLFQVGIQL